MAAVRSSKGAIVTAIVIVGALVCVLMIGSATADLAGAFLRYRGSR